MFDAETSIGENGTPLGTSSTYGPTPGAVGGGGSVNKEIVIMNGTVGGIITTRITRFPESLVPTISPQGSATAILIRIYLCLLICLQDFLAVPLI